MTDPPDRLAAKPPEIRGVSLPAAAVEQPIAELAGRQHGVVAYRQLRALGYTRRMIENRIETGRLLRLHKGVYAVGHRKLTLKGHWLAAVLAYGPDAVLSHRCAAALLELRATAQTRIDVTVPGTSRRRRPGISAHRARTLHPDDRTTVDGIPVTSVARTILDLASVLTAERLLYLIEQTVRLQLFDINKLDDAIYRCPNRAGLGKLRRVLADYREPPPTRSGFERRFLAFIERTELPSPLVNVIVAGERVDIFWPQYRLVVELDGRPYHNSPRAIETDKRRDAILQRARLRVLRVTDKRFDQSPLAVLDDIRALIALAA